MEVRGEVHDVDNTGVFGREPVMYLALIQAALALAMGFGLDFTVEQTGLVLAFTAAVLGFLSRSQVTPMESLPEMEVVEIDQTWPPRPVRRDGPAPENE